MAVNSDRCLVRFGLPPHLLLRRHLSCRSIAGAFWWLCYLAGSQPLNWTSVAKHLFLVYLILFEIQEAVGHCSLMSFEEYRRQLAIDWMDEEGQCLLYMNKQIDTSHVYRIITRNLINKPSNSPNHPAAVDALPSTPIYLSPAACPHRSRSDCAWHYIYIKH